MKKDHHTQPENAELFDEQDKERTRLEYGYGKKTVLNRAIILEV